RRATRRRRAHGGKDARSRLPRRTRRVAWPVARVARAGARHAGSTRGDRAHRKLHAGQAVRRVIAARWRYELGSDIVGDRLLEETRGAMSDIKLMSSGGLKGVISELAGAFEEASGQKLSAVFGPPTAVKTRIESGEPVDVAVMSAALIDDLVRQGKLIA